VRSSSPVAVVLAAWLGAGVLFATVVAPAAFAVLPSRTLAGALVGRVLPTLFLAGIVVALVAAIADRSAAGRSPRVRRAALLTLALSCGIAQFVVGPRIERIRREIPGPVEQLAAGDPRRAAFGRLHAISVGWLGLAMVAAAVTVVLVSMTPRYPGAPSRP
jgi:hypothetical protein